MYQARSRGSHRLTVTLPAGVVRQLEVRANEEGRSMSNLVAFLVEARLHDDKSS